MHSVKYCCYEDEACPKPPTHRITLGFRVVPSQGDMGLLYCKPHAKAARDKMQAWYRWNSRQPGATRPVI